MANLAGASKKFLHSSLGFSCEESMRCRDSQFGDLTTCRRRPYFLPSISTSRALAILLSKVAGMGWSTAN